MAMPKSKKGSKKGSAQVETSVQLEETGASQAEASQPEASQPDQEDYEDDCHGKGPKEQFHFDPATEEQLVEFFKENPCFYDKADPMFANKAVQEKKLLRLATELKTTPLKIRGWLKSQHTALGRVYKKKSGQVGEVMTARQKWLVDNISYLKAHIAPRPPLPLGTVQDLLVVVLMLAPTTQTMGIPSSLPFRTARCLVHPHQHVDLASVPAPRAMMRGWRASCLRRGSATSS